MSRIPDEQAAIDLAALILDMGMVTSKGLAARDLARRVLGIPTRGPRQIVTFTNGTTRVIREDEPVFLLRGQDAHAAAAVRFWADQVEAAGGDPEIIQTARLHAIKMDGWPTKKQPDLPSHDA